MNGTQNLPGYNWWDNGMTVEVYNQGCRELGYKVAAPNSNRVSTIVPELSADIQCSRGPMWNQGPKTASMECAYTCGGNATEKCGGWP